MAIRMMGAKSKMLSKRSNLLCLLCFILISVLLHYKYKTFFLNKKIFTRFFHKFFHFFLSEKLHNFYMPKTTLAE